MATPSPVDGRTKILDAVIEIVQAEGLDAVQLREVTRRAHVSTRTVYEIFGNREHLICEALKSWTERSDLHIIENLEPIPGEAPLDAVRRLLTLTMKPWEEHPKMLEAVHRMTSTPEGQELGVWGTEFLRSTVRSQLSSTEPAYAADVAEIVALAATGLVSNFSNGRIPVTEILPGLDLVLRRLQTET